MYSMTPYIQVTMNIPQIANHCRNLGGKIIGIRLSVSHICNYVSKYSLTHITFMKRKRSLKGQSKNDYNSIDDVNKNIKLHLLIKHSGNMYFKMFIHMLLSQ